MRGWRCRLKGMGPREIETQAIEGRGDAALWALDIALSAIDAPAFVVDPGGAILHAQQRPTLLARDRLGVTRSLAQAIAGEPADPRGT